MNLDLKGLRIKGFQAHRFLKIEFGAITTIVGATDIGKSSIIRALKWLILNKPRGTEFINHDSDMAIVSLQMEGARVTRERSKSENLYKLKKGGKIRRFEFDKENRIPEDVTKALNMNELNFQFQFDAPYWLSCSPGEVSRQLNKIVDLGIIDESLSNLSKKVRAANSTINVVKSRCEQAQETVRSLQYVEDMEKKYEELEKRRRKKEKAEKTVTDLFNIIQGVEEQERALKGVGEVLKAANRALSLGVRWEQATKTRRGLESQLQEIEGLEGKAGEKIPDLSPLETIERKYKQAQQNVLALERFVKGIEEKEKAVCLAEGLYQKINTTFQKKSAGTCPLCGSVTK